jgi:hypothetical protein
MTNSQNSKQKMDFTLQGNLARLLAAENMTVVHDGKATQSTFDTNTRILTLPVYKDTTDSLYKCLVANAAGRAKYTPASLTGIDMAVEYIDPKNPNRVKAFVNIIEDSRVEKAMGRKFPAIIGEFYQGYKDFSDIHDGFGLKLIEEMGMTVNDLDFIDRINLYFKMDRFNTNRTIDFSDEELGILDQIENINTFDEVVELAKKLYTKPAFDEPPMGGQGGQGESQQPQQQKGQQGQGKGNQQSNEDPNSLNEDQRSFKNDEVLDDNTPQNGDDEGQQDQQGQGQQGQGQHPDQKRIHMQERKKFDEAICSFHIWEIDVDKNHHDQVADEPECTSDHKLP